MQRDLCPREEETGDSKDGTVDYYGSKGQGKDCSFGNEDSVNFLPPSPPLVQNLLALLGRWYAFLYLFATGTLPWIYILALMIVNLLMQGLISLRRYHWNLQSSTPVGYLNNKGDNYI